MSRSFVKNILMAHFLLNLLWTHINSQGPAVVSMHLWIFFFFLYLWCSAKPISSARNQLKLWGYMCARVCMLTQKSKSLCSHHLFATACSSSKNNNNGKKRTPIGKWHRHTHIHTFSWFCSRYSLTVLRATLTAWSGGYPAPHTSSNTIHIRFTPGLSIDSNV